MLGTDGKGTQISTGSGESSTATDIYGTGTVAQGSSTLSDATGTKAYYYNFKIDYMISTSSKDKLKIGIDNVKVTGKDKYTTTTDDGTSTTEVDVVIAGSYKAGEYYYGTDGAVTPATKAGTATAGTDVATLDKATRVAFINAATYPDTDKVTYADSGTEYAIATACGKDHNYNALHELGYTAEEANREYKQYDEGQTVLDNGTTNVHSVTTPSGAKTTLDKSFTYGSVDVYVWFDGTDKACTNAIFSQTLDYLFNNIEDCKNGNVIKK